jgi:hypothetical protein
VLALHWTSLPRSVNGSLQACISGEKPACDWRANFRVMRDNVGLRETTPPFAIEFPLSTPLLPDASGSYRAELL